MNTPNNARSTLSKQKLKKAFISLLEKKNFNDITVGEICKEACVNRTTFYTHYANVQELYSALEVDLHQFLERTLLTSPVLNNEDSVLEMICPVLELVKKHKNIHLNYIDKLFELDYVVELCESVRKKYMPLMFHNATLPVELENYFFVFCRNGIVGVIREWLAKDCVEDTVTIAESILFIMNQMRINTGN